MNVHVLGGGGGGGGGGVCLGTRLKCIDYSLVPRPKHTHVSSLAVHRSYADLYTGRYMRVCRQAYTRTRIIM